MLKSRQPSEPLVRSLSLGLPAGHRIEAHQHDWAQVVYIERGVLAVESNRRRWIAPPFRALEVPAGVEHAVITVSEARMRTVYLPPDSSDSESGEIRVVEVSPLLRELILEIARIGALRLDDEVHRGLAIVLRDRLRGASDLPLTLPWPTDPRAAGIAERVVASPGADETLERLAERAGSSSRTIERLFRDQTGISFGRWRQQARLQFAVRRLGERASVSEVSLECGYESVSAFVSVFRQSFGVTPGQWRR
jgi:AraC-like DNA-binding protein